MRVAVAVGGGGEVQVRVMMSEEGRGKGGLEDEKAGVREDVEREWSEDWEGGD